jgi:hypothetical protein
LSNVAPAVRVGADIEGAIIAEAIDTGSPGSIEAGVTAVPLMEAVVDLLSSQDAAWSAGVDGDPRTSSKILGLTVAAPTICN